jgi:hypothetical protein
MALDKLKFCITNAENNYAIVNRIVVVYSRVAQHKRCDYSFRAEVGLRIKYSTRA